MEKITFLFLVSVFHLVLISKTNHRVIKKILRGKFMQRYNSSVCLVGKWCVFFVKRKYTELICGVTEQVHQQNLSIFVTKHVTENTLALVLPKISYHAVGKKITRTNKPVEID